MSQQPPTESPSATYGLRWLRWFGMTATLIFCLWAFAYIAVSEWELGARNPSLACGLVALAAGFFSFGLLRLGLACLGQLSTLRADRDGLKHCMLPTIPWVAVRGIDVRKYIPRTNVSGGNYRSALVIACDQNFLLGWTKRWVWDLLSWVGPRYDLNQALVEFKLEFMPVEPGDLLATLTAIAKHYKAPLVKTWVHGQPIEVAFQREQAFDALKERDLEMQSVFRKLNLAAHEETNSSKDIPKK